MLVTVHVADAAQAGRGKYVCVWAFSTLCVLPRILIAKAAATPPFELTPTTERAKIFHPRSVVVFSTCGMNVHMCGIGREGAQCQDPLHPHTKPDTLTLVDDCNSNT